MLDPQSLYISAVLLSLIAGSAIPIGALLASHEHIRKRWLKMELHHGVTALGGGALLAAVALVLVPEGMHGQPLWTAALSFIGGGVVAMRIDLYFAKRKSTASQLVAMMLDFVPETIVIGAVITKNTEQAIMLAAIIFVQNLPESFNAFREMKKSNGMGTRQLLFWFTVVGVSGPLYVYIGAVALADSGLWLGMLMTFSAGGILYLVFNDVAPQVPVKNHYMPPMGALLGFLIGMIGYALTR